MNKDKIDPWKLLKRAREHVKAQFDALDYCGGPDDCHCSNAQEVYCLLEEIDSAIKYHEEDIGWIQEGQYADYCGKYGSGFIVPRRMELEHRFFWRIFRQNKKSQYDEGYTETFEEAKEQATESLRRKVYG